LADQISVSVFASGGTCAPLAYRLTNKQLKFPAVVGRSNQSERVRLWRNLSASGGRSLNAQSHIIIDLMPLLDLSASGGRLTNNNYFDFGNLLVLKLSFCALEVHQ
jgi:hypothetical protein